MPARALGTLCSWYLLYNLRPFFWFAKQACPSQLHGLPQAASGINSSGSQLRQQTGQLSDTQVMSPSDTPGHNTADNPTLFQRPSECSAGLHLLNPLISRIMPWHVEWLRAMGRNPW